MTFFSSPLIASEKPLSRLELVEICVSHFENRFVDEVEAIRSGLLAPYPDGRMHLDWPATRGVTAGAIARLSIKRGLPAKPAYFQDVGPTSPLAPSLSQVGELFPALDGDRFRTEQLVFLSDLNNMLKMVDSPAPDASATIKLPEGLRPGSGDFVAGRHYSSGYSFPGDVYRNAQPGQSGSDTGPIGRTSSVVPIDQMTPQGGFDLNLAMEGIEEIESRLDPLEVNVFDLLGIRDAAPEEERKITVALSSIHQVINDALEKLEFAQRQLQTAILADPVAISNTLDLRGRIVQDITRLQRIRQRLEPRLRQAPKSNTE